MAFIDFEERGKDLIFYRTIVLLLVVLMTGCQHQELSKASPEDVLLTGTWQFARQDELSFQHLQNALNYIPYESINRLATQSRNDDYYFKQQEYKVLRNFLVGLLTITPDELFIKQSERQLAVDFGVAGYHVFKFGDKSEILMNGLEIDAYAGWLGNEFIIRMGDDSSSQLYDKFSLSNGSRLVETIELRISGRKTPLVHKRFYERID